MLADILANPLVLLSIALLSVSVIVGLALVLVGSTYDPFDPLDGNRW
jgi:hypothetical protein